MELSIQNITKQPGTSMPVTALINQEMIDDLFVNIILEHAMVLEATATSQLDDSIKIAGTITGDFLVPCDRCLKDVPVHMDIDLEEFFSRNTAEVEQGEDIQDVYPYSGHIISLDKMIRDNLFLHWPTQTLCEPDCKGLCSICGVNRNEISCNCQEKLEEEKNNNHPLKALLTLLNEDEEV